MNILLLTGLFEELRLFLEQHPCSYSKKLRAYRSRWYPNLFAATTGPGLRRSRELRRILDAVRPGRIVNAGLVGILRGDDTCRAGDLIEIAQVVRQRDRIVYPGTGGGGTLVSVTRPVFHPSEKADLAHEYHARACDMEAGELLALVSRPAAWRPYDSTVVLCKVAGDLPSDYELFQHEHLLRGWSGRGRLSQLWGMLTFPGGPGRFRRLRDYREQVLAALTLHIHRTLKPILDSGGSTDTCHSVFRPQ